jgi:hypothetical protein
MGATTKSDVREGEGLPNPIFSPPFSLGPLPLSHFSLVSRRSCAACGASPRWPLRQRSSFVRYVAGVGCLHAQYRLFASPPPRAAPSRSFLLLPPTPVLCLAGLQVPGPVRASEAPRRPRRGDRREGRGPCQAGRQRKSLRARAGGACARQETRELYVCGDKEVEEEIHALRAAAGDSVGVVARAGGYSHREATPHAIARAVRAPVTMRTRR